MKTWFALLALMGAAFAVSCGSDQPVVDVSTDVDAPCGGACSENDVCLDGLCVSACPMALTACDGECVDLSSNRQSCGGCGEACNGFCQNGECLDDCTGPSRLTCGDSCVDGSSDPDHCGDCNVACEEGHVCSYGVCTSTCAGNLPERCDDRCVDPMSDRDHCGGCNRACAADEFCSEGQCDSSCAGSTPDRCGTVCVDRATDPHHCGECHEACEDGQVCVEGACQDGCVAPRSTQCGDLCVDTMTDARFCGGCQRSCSSGERCEQGRCVVGCPREGRRICGGTCVDVDRDPENCGSCGVRCKNSVCSGGLCTSGCGDAYPDECDGVCTDTRTDPDNCGSCGEPCPFGQVCQDGACEVVCSGETPDACSQSCVDLDSDPRHCGSCDHACEPGETCSDGKCKSVCTGTRDTLCDGQCVDPITDANNCGGCGIVCAAGSHCNDRRCQATVVDIVSGSSAVCADLADGTTTCWGDNQSNAVGPGVEAERYTIAKLTGFSGELVQYDLGYGHGCATVDVDPADLGMGGAAGASSMDGAPRRIECWGKNYAGQTGAEDMAITHLAHPVGLPVDEIPTVVHTGEYWSAALMESGTVWSWGSNGNYELGRAGNGPEPLPVDGVADAAALFVGPMDGCVRAAYADGGAVHCWGWNGYGQLGLPASYVNEGLQLIDNLPLPENGVAVEHSIAIGYTTLCAIALDGEVHCWGDGNYGQLGRGESVTASSEPAPVSGLPKRAVRIDAGFYHVCALLEDDSLWCWGRHLASGGLTPAWTPERIFESGVRTAVAVSDATFALLEPGELWSWGYRRAEFLNRPAYDGLWPRPCCDNL